MIIATFVLRPSKFHKKNNTQGDHKYSEGMHFQIIRLDVSYDTTYISNSVCYFSEKLPINTTERARDLGMTSSTSDIVLLNLSLVRLVFRVGLSSCIMPWSLLSLS